MIDSSWLGRYEHGDDEETGVTTVRLRQDGDVVRFGYNYTCRNNHGYTLASEQGIVVAATDTEITIEVRESSAASWSDWYKDEAYDDKSTSTRQSTIRILRAEQGRPVLGYGRVELTFVGEGQ